MSNKSGIGLIAVPKGGGALRGLGEKFAPDLFTGTGNYSVPIELPPGRNGFQPQLSLVYSTGYGNSPFGLGWSLNVPGIERKSSKGVPAYDDDKDVFILSGSEDLVAVSREGNTTRYQPRTETTFARIERYDAGVDGQDYWEVWSRDGTVSRYGVPRLSDVEGNGSSSAIIADPANKRRCYAWKLSEVRDPFDNLIEYAYIRDEVREDGPHKWDQSYLSEIRYVDYGDPANPSFLVHVKFYYEPRPDPFSEYRSGFEIRTVKRAKTIEILTNADGLARVRTFHLKYLDELHSLSESPPSNQISLLAQIEAEGHDDNHSVPEKRSQRLPPLIFSYGQYEPQKRRAKLVEGDALPAVSLADANYELVDLFGNGLPDILEMSSAQIRFWRNLGAGRFDRPRQMQETPAGLSLSEPGVQLIDANGDGRTDLVINRPSLAGFYPLDFQGGWDRRSFRVWESGPSFSLEDSEVRLVDLDGNGVTDAIRSTSSSFECFFNHPDRGWHTTRVVPRRQLWEFPDVSFSSPDVKWADMTGDGLNDIVVVRGNRVDYWPSLGRGDFAQRITMRNPPQLPYGYDPRRVLLGDVDGDGVCDLVYVDDQKVVVWINRSGNSWSNPVEIPGTPRVTDFSAVRLVDLLGTGVPVILWSRDVNGAVSEGMFFLDLMGNHKPYLLEKIDNSMGAITNIAYAPSTHYYCEDQGTPDQWRTTLPFPVYVVARVESVDQLSRGKLTNEYRYHHGYWDGFESEFRGFGRVDSWDTEVFEEYHQFGLDPGRQYFNEVELRHFSPPTELRTWFHLGPVGGELSFQELDYSAEYWSGDQPAFRRPADLAAELYALPRRHKRDALRALRGRVFRTELFARDGSNRAERPYTVTEQSHCLRTLIADGVTGGVFFPFQLAERTTQWERGDDPMTQLEFKEDYDNYGLPRVQIMVAVPRGRDYIKPTTAPAQPFLATYDVTAYAQKDDATHYIVDRVAQHTQYEIINDGLADSSGDSQPSALWIWDSIRSGYPIKHQVVRQNLYYYDGSDYVGLDIGQIGDYGAVKRVEQLVLSEERLREGYRLGQPGFGPAGQPSYFSVNSGTPAWTGEYPSEFRERISQFVQPPPRGQAILGGYIFHTNDPRGRQRGFFSTTTQRAYNERGLVVGERDPFGHETAFHYEDTYDLLLTRVVGPTLLEIDIGYDYRVLQPRVVTDSNGNQVKYGYAALGLLESEAWLGKPNRPAEGDKGRSSTVFSYDFKSFYRSKTPIYRHTKRYKLHITDPNDAGEVIETREYVDGFGRQIQNRAHVEDVLFGSEELGDGVLPVDQAQNSEPIARIRDPERNPANVVISGWQQFDNKGRVVERYEPCYSTGWDYTDPNDAQHGGNATLYYDPLGRVTRVVHSDASEHVVIHGIPSDVTNPVEFEPSPWEVYAYDANDNAERTHSTDQAVGTYSYHWNTPSSVLLDALGRPVKQIERNGQHPQIDWYTTRKEYDIQGNLLRVWDEFNRKTTEHIYDLADRRLRTEHLDAGITLNVYDAAGNVLERRDSKGSFIFYAYDELLRNTHVWARDNSEQERTTLRERVIYGESQESGLSRSQASAKNLLGKPYTQYDEAGRLCFREYDFKGNVLEKELQVISDQLILSNFDEAPTNNWRITTFRIDWTHASSSSLEAHAESILDPTIFEISYRFDAQNRLKQFFYPLSVDGIRKQLKMMYNSAGQLQRVLLDGQVLVEHIAYNVKGQRTLITYGDRDTRKPGPRLMTRYAYNPKNFNLVRLRTERFHSSAQFTFTPEGVALQDIAFAYDLAGNLIQLLDRTPGCGVANSELGPNTLCRIFAFDPLYRLIKATGRECKDVPKPREWGDNSFCGYGARDHGASDQGNAPEITAIYTEEYAYDPVGNMVTLTKHNNGNSWTRYFGMGGRNPFQWRQEYEVQMGSNDEWMNAPNNTLTHVGDDQIDVSQTHGFDSTGNLVVEKNEHHLEWDHSNRLREFRIQRTGEEPLTYSYYCYDRSGHRVKKLVRNRNKDVKSTVHIENMFERHSVSDASTSYQYDMIHVYDNDSHIVRIRVGNGPAVEVPAVLFTISDHLQSSVLTIDQGGTWVNREEYTAYGETTFGGFDGKTYRYAGKGCDQESGFRYFGARYFAPWLARWLSPDALNDSDKSVAYEFMMNNPFAWYDPSGLRSGARRSSRRGSSRRGSRMVQSSNATKRQQALQRKHAQRQHQKFMNWYNSFVNRQEQTSGLGGTAGPAATPFQAVGVSMADLHEEYLHRVEGAISAGAIVGKDRYHFAIPVGSTFEAVQKMKEFEAQLEPGEWRTYSFMFRRVPGADLLTGGAYEFVGASQGGVMTDKLLVIQKVVVGLLPEDVFETAETLYNYQVKTANREAERVIADWQREGQMTFDVQTNLEIHESFLRSYLGIDTEEPKDVE